MLLSLVESIDVMLRAERGVQQVIDRVRSQPAWRRWLGGSARTIAALSATHPADGPIARDPRPRIGPRRGSIL